MTCTNCQQLRDQLRDALLDFKLRQAAGIALEGIAIITKIKGAKDGDGSVVEENRGTDAGLQPASGSGPQTKRSRRGPRDNAAAGEGREYEGEDRVPSFKPDGVDRYDAPDQSER